MALIILSILLLGCVLIATSYFTKMNKAAVAMFAGTVGWVLYICYGADFVMSQHSREYLDFLSGAVANSENVKQYIASDIFLKYVGRGAEIVFFLLSTMAIVEILDNNGCFDFLQAVLRTRRTQRLLWTMTALTFVLSANLDNLTTTVMMLVVMRKLLPSRRHRLVFGSAIVLAANCGGALTVIGDPNGLMLWSTGAVTATNFSLALAIPCLLSWIVPTLWLSRQLPDHVEIQGCPMPYRGDDTRLRPWQRLLMFFVGIGGLWFIPTFHNITKLSPFLGALCVLSVLWIVNEVVNRKLINADQMIQRPTPRAVQYGVIQLMLFVMGVTLAVGAVRETGMMDALARWGHLYINNVWLMGALAAASSTVLDTFAACACFASLHSVTEPTAAVAMADDFAQNGLFWKVVAYCSAMGGNILLIGSASGLALLKMERMHVGWYFKHVGLVSLVALVLGMVVLWALA